MSSRSPKLVSPALRVARLAESSGAALDVPSVGRQVGLLLPPGTPEAATVRLLAEMRQRTSAWEWGRRSHPSCTGTGDGTGTHRAAWRRDGQSHTLVVRPVGHDSRPPYRWQNPVGSLDEKQRSKSSSSLRHGRRFRPRRCYGPDRRTTADPLRARLPQ